MAVAQAEQGDRREVAAGGPAADQQPVCTELGRRTLEQPQCDRFTVVGAGGVGVFGREPVVDADNRDLGGLGQGPVGLVVHGCAANNPATAVEVEVGALHRLGDEYPYRHATAGPIDRPLVDQVIEARTSERPLLHHLPGRDDAFEAREVDAPIPVGAHRLTDDGVDCACFLGVGVELRVDPEHRFLSPTGYERHNHASQVDKTPPQSAYCGSQGPESGPRNPGFVR